MVASLASTAAIGMVLYAVSTSLPFLATPSNTDVRFGATNQCLMGALQAPRVGFAVSWDAGAVAGYTGDALALCEGAHRVASLAQPGVQSASWDATGTLWLALDVPDAGQRLAFLSPDGGVEELGDVAPVALAGHAQGVVVLDASGKLTSLKRNGEALGWAELSAGPVGPARLSVNADGTLVAVVTGGGFLVYRTNSLERVRAEAPCDLEYLWWSPRGTQAILDCGPRAAFALALDVTTGAREAAPKRARVRSTLVPGAGVYVGPCEQLPCQVDAP